ncbi:MAG: Tat pathway signal sequence domain protein [Caulobacteraceae bacterium]
MRRPLTLGLSLLLLAGLPIAKAYAQSQDADDQRRQAQADEDAKKKKKDKDWKVDQAPLPNTNSAGPCPFAKALYDASRYVELKDGEENPSAVSYTGEIEHVLATCEYKGVEPIHVHLGVGFEFGKGPLAKSDHKEYRYWVAVTVRNLAVLDKQYFTVAADFPKGSDRVVYADHLADILIPRAKSSVSGTNFEILVGFDVTPQMAEFNRLGKRFRANASADPEPTPAKTAANTGTTGSK